MEEREQSRKVRHRRAGLRHAEEITGQRRADGISFADQVAAPLAPPRVLEVGCGARLNLMHLKQRPGIRVPLTSTRRRTSVVIRDLVGTQLRALDEVLDASKGTLEGRETRG